MVTATKNSKPFDSDPLANDSLSQHLVEVATNAALKVGDMLVKAAADARAGEVSITEKSSFHDLVTKYDKEAEQIIADYIFQHHPDSTLVGEEGGSQGNGSVHWYVDPIDGTSNFATGVPFFCVSIGAVCGDQILAGVIYDPNRDELFSASTRGAFLNNEPIKAKGNTSDAQSLLITAFPSPHIPVTDEDFLTYGELIRGFATVRRMGSAALALAYVACGRADVMYEPAINPWDITAGTFIIEQAGGRCITFGQRDGSMPEQTWLRPTVIATCPEFDVDRSVINTLMSTA